MENIEWGTLPFGYFKTDYNVRCYNRNGEWGQVEISSSEYINVHMACTGLHYGQEAFEGMKAFRGKDGKVRMFRWEENAKRLRTSADGIMMAPVPDEVFFEAITKVVKLNEKYIPPYGTGAALYLRPLLFGSGAEVGVKPSTEYMFVVFCGPVGPYFKEGFKPVKIQLISDYDRTAPQGTGHIKVGGNYAASLRPAFRAKEEGYASVLFTDSKEHKFIDEAGPANFFGIKDNTYITPHSKTILPSITNMSLEQIAKDLGLKSERRPVEAAELDTFEEAGACGTAAIISPIGLIHDRSTDKKITYGSMDQAGPISTKLYETLKGIQEGEIEDKHGWNYIFDL